MERTERFPVTTAWIATWIAMRSLDEPLPYARIGNWYGVSASIVHRYCKGKVPNSRARRGSWRKRFNWDRARELDNEGKMSRAEIARYLGVTPARITQVLGPKRSEAA